MSKIVQTDTAALLSKQVTGARYFFLNLAPRPTVRLALVMGGFEHCNPDYVVSRSHFPFTSIEYVVAGRGYVKFGERRHDLKPGVVFSYGPATRHEIHTAPDDVLVKYFISLSGHGVPARLRRCKIPPGQPRLLAPHTEIATVFDQLVREGQRSSPLRPTLCASLTEFLLCKLESAALLTPHINERAREAFLRCKAFIDADTERLRTLGEVARAVGAEASSICRWFRHYQGVSPYQYLLRRRMDLAAQRLVEHGGLVKEVAQNFGFTDPFHFSHQFKAVHGVSPSTLLRSHRAPGHG